MTHISFLFTDSRRIPIAVQKLNKRVIKPGFSVQRTEYCKPGIGPGVEAVQSSSNIDGALNTAL